MEDSLRVAVAESYFEGVSNQKSREKFSKFGLKENISASEVSELLKSWINWSKDFLNRPIEGIIPYIFVDASYFKV